MIIIGWLGLGSVFKRNKELEFMVDLDLIADTANRVHMKRLALDTCVSFLGRTISQSEFRVRNGKAFEKNELYYRLNVRPNKNMTASTFWERFIRKLIYDNECLVIQADDGDLLIDNSKNKTRKMLAATATVTMLATGMVSSSDVFAEGTQQQKNLSTSLQEEKSVKSENRTYTVPGKGDVEVLKQQERKSMAFSPYEPTGLYAKSNEQITINVEGNQNIQAYIGTYSYDASWREDSKIKSFTLKPGINTIQSPNGGMIYFYNKQQGGTIRTTVTTGGTTTPFFELGKHTKQDLIDMLNQYPNAHAVELKGERVLITASPARVKKYLLGSNTDPVQLLKKMDEATRIQDNVLRNICWVLIQILYNS
ncbi:phage portal protein [Bacillus thuringiensis]|nr:phage portal protein [Bacillus thuringiensis]